MTPWYVEKLGLCKVCHIRWREYETAIYKFTERGKWVTLTTRTTGETCSALRLFTKSLSAMKRVLPARGIHVGPEQRDRQGTRYFEVGDPEGNIVEVVEER